MTLARKKRAVSRVKRTALLRVLSLLLLILIFVVWMGIREITAALKDMPKLSLDKPIESAQTSKIYASDGTLLADFFAEQNRVLIPLSDISLHLQHAVVAIEDERFYEHQGVDVKAIARALYINLRSGRVVEGGSTISQQYVKNSFVTPEKTMSRKIKEAVLAYQLEKTFSKKKILEKYLNTIYFGQSVYGTQTAAQFYFSKDAKDLNLEESALLAGLIRSPGHYSPLSEPQKALARRNTVLRRMAELGFITKDEAQVAMGLPLTVSPRPLKVSKSPYFVEYIKQTLIDQFGANMVFKGGLRVYSTVDPKMQQYAEEAVTKVLDKPDDPSASIVALEPRTGYIRALVGGKDFNTQKFNLAVQGHRQAGSAFKTFVLTSAIDQGISPDKVYQSSPVTIKLPIKDWEVHNYTEGSGGGPMTMREGTIRSVNAVYARLVMDVGAENVVEMAKKMGIVTQLDPYPAIALGGLRIGVSPLEMASAYATLGNEGKHVKPVAIIKVTNASGDLLFKAKREETQAMDSSVAYIVTDILQDVIKYGTGTRANIGRPQAGKTGTTQNYRDAWFVGYTPDLAAAVWVGHPQGQISMTRVHGIRVAGGTFPAQIWARFMHRALEDVPPSDFPVPETGLKRVKICTESSLLATRYCPTTKTATFMKGTTPTKYCDLHTAPEDEEKKEGEEKNGKEGKNEVSVPSVVGMSTNEAISTLQNAGFGVAQSMQASEVPPNQVISQSPSGSAPPGSTIVILVSSGPPEPQPGQ
jgi:penicillin-binding protein 1A